MSRNHEAVGWDTRAGKAHREQSMRLLGRQCAQCGRDETDGVQLTLDHMQELEDGGDPYSIDNEQVLCSRCHREKTRAANRARFFETTRTPRAPVEVATMRGGRADPRTNAPHYVESRQDSGRIEMIPDRDPAGIVRPRFETAPHPAAAGTLGDEAAAQAARMFGRPQRDWQQHCLRRGLEVDAAGRLVWRIVIVTVARQQGKSDLMRAVAVHRMTCNRWPDAQLCVHTANRVQTAREIWQPMVMLARARSWQIARGRGEEEIMTLTGSRYLIRAAGDALGIGYTVDLGLVDEAWDVAREPVENGLMPAQSARPDAQLWLFSTAGESTSDLLRTYRDAAISELEAPGSVLILEWSAPEAADPDSPETWKWASPYWTPDREIAIRTDKQRMDTARFRANYCNQWVQTIGGFVDPAVWEAARGVLEDPAGPVHVAVECSHDGMQHTIASAELAADGLILIRASHHAGYDEIGAVLSAWRRDRRITRLLVTPPYEKRLPPDLTGRFDIVGRRETPEATRTLAETLADSRLIHGGDPVLTAHMLRSRASRTESGVMLSSVKSAGTIHAARAAMFAIWSAVTAPAPRRRATVRFRE